MSQDYIYGRNPVLEVLKTDREVKEVYLQDGRLKGNVSEIISLAKKKNLKINKVDKSYLDKLSKNGVHQGIAISVGEYKYSSVDEILAYAESKEEEAFVLILDEIEDPHNLGAIARTAEAAGAHGLIIPKRRSASVTETVYKASAGAVEHIRIAQVTNLTQTIKDLKDKGMWIYGTDVDGELYYNTDISGSVGLVIGNEGKGMSRLVKENCDFLLKIPMRGKVDSLNASNAASILIYEVIRQSYVKGK